MDSKKWIDDATSGAHGQFREKAKKRGLSTAAFAKQILNNPTRYDAKTRKQAGLAHTLMGMHK